MNKIVDIELLEKECNLTRADATCLVSQESTKGRIIGISNRPGLRYSEGVYLTCVSMDKPATHHKVGK